jgi:signal transduction histidine kinase
LVGKLVAIALLPAFFILTLGVLRVSDQIGAASELGAANRLLQVREQVAAAATALRDERDLATRFVADRRRGDRDPLNEAIQRTDAAVTRARAGIAEVDDIIGPPARAALRQADGRFAQLSAVRTSVTGTALLLPGQVLQRYTFIVNRADGLDRAVVQQVQQTGEPTTVGLAEALVAVTAAAEAIELQHTVVGVPLIADAVTPEDRNAAAAADSTFITSYISYEVALPEDVEPVNFVTADANSRRGAVRSAVLLGPTDGPVAVSPAEWDEASHGARGVVLDAERQVVTALTDAGAAAEGRLRNLAWLNSAVLLLGLLLTATVVAVVTRSLTGSLRLLRTSALDIAYARLPQAVNDMRAGSASDVTVEPVPLRSRDEVGQVARAFDVVHGEAVRLAGETVQLAADQAALQSSVNDMFANLSRRSTGLVDRQLQLIEQLENHEADPRQLTNLVQLDHLAVRMRRNSQNLLVLAGTDTARPTTAPTLLVDVLRTAVSQVEQDHRIDLEVAPHVTVVGHVINDLVHLLAELLDNATNFSPPDTPVVIRSTLTADRSILIEIVDLGVGMKVDELAAANRLLSTPSAVDVATSRRMGLFVVGRLGGRHGIAVSLSGARTDGADDGLTAAVTLPAHFVLSSNDFAVVSTDEHSEPQPRHRAADPAFGHGLLPERTGGLDRPDPWPGSPARTTWPVVGADSVARDPDVAPLFDPGDEGDPPPTESVETAQEWATNVWADWSVAAADPSANGDGAPPTTNPFPVVVDHRSPPATADRFRSPDGEELLAPGAPATAEPDGALPTTGGVDVGMTTPVLPSAVSAWLAHHPTPVVPQQNTRGRADRVLIAGASGDPGHPGRFDEPPGSGDPNNSPITSGRAEGPRADPARPGPSRPSNGQPTAPDPAVAIGRMTPRPPAGEDADRPLSTLAFATAADEGWRASAGAAVERQDETTASGLPKRRSPARLVLGGAGPAVPAAGAAPGRDAEDRDRLVTHQQIVRQSRRTAVHGDSEGDGADPVPRGTGTAAQPTGEHDDGDLRMTGFIGSRAHGSAGPSSPLNSEEST